MGHKFNMSGLGNINSLLVPLIGSDFPGNSTGSVSVEP